MTREKIHKIKKVKEKYLEMERKFDILFPNPDKTKNNWCLLNYC